MATQATGCTIEKGSGKYHTLDQTILERLFDIIAIEKFMHYWRPFTNCPAAGFDEV